MKTFAPWARLYGNAYLDMHLIDVERDQNFVSSIDGFGTSFALMSEWGMMHEGNHGTTEWDTEKTEDGQPGLFCCTDSWSGVDHLSAANTRGCHHRGSVDFLFLLAP